MFKCFSFHLFEQPRVFTFVSYNIIVYENNIFMLYDIASRHSSGNLDSFVQQQCGRGEGGE